tara:strand:- start:864 stop:1598 length:735 start_codon:yes stop_codon:yes gene_type:complete
MDTLIQNLGLTTLNSSNEFIKSINNEEFEELDDITKINIYIYILLIQIKYKRQQLKKLTKNDLFIASNEYKKLLSVLLLILVNLYKNCEGGKIFRSRVNTVSSLKSPKSLKNKTVIRSIVRSVRTHYGENINKQFTELLLYVKNKIDKNMVNSKNYYDKIFKFIVKIIIPDSIKRNSLLITYKDRSIVLIQDINEPINKFDITVSLIDQNKIEAQQLLDSIKLDVKLEKLENEALERRIEKLKK